MLGGQRNGIRRAQKSPPCSTATLCWSIAERLDAICCCIVPQLGKHFLVRHQRDVVPEAHKNRCPYRIRGIDSGECHVCNADSYTRNRNPHRPAQKVSTTLQL